MSEVNRMADELLNGTADGDPRLAKLIGSTFDLGINLLVYDRRNDDELSTEDVEDLIAEGKVDVGLLVEVFRKGLEDTGILTG